VSSHDLDQRAWASQLAAYAEAGIILRAVVPRDDLLDRAPLAQTPDLVDDLRQVLEAEVATAQDLHETSCSSRGADWSTCDCRLGRLLAEDATTKLRVLDQVYAFQSPALLRVVAELLAIPYARMHPELNRHVARSKRITD
jgi:hypothetical protein